MYKLKKRAHRKIIYPKACWLIRGFEQHKGVDYYKTFVTILKAISYKAWFAMAAAMDLKIEQIDAKTTFLYGETDDHIYVI